jgi:hypothetical protein
LLPCEEKLVFDTKKQAEAAATTLRWQKGTRLKVYRCRHCNLWHLSSDHSS